MDTQTFKSRMESALAGFIGALAVALATTAISYLGAHVPDIVAFIAQVAGGGAVAHSVKQ